MAYFGMPRYFLPFHKITSALILSPRIEISFCSIKDMYFGSFRQSTSPSLLDSYYILFLNLNLTGLLELGNERSSLTPFELGRRCL